MPLTTLILMLLSLHTRAEDARRQAGDAAVQSGAAVTAGDETGMREASARPFDGVSAEEMTVVAPGVMRGAAPLAKPTPGSLQAKAEPPIIAGKKTADKKISTGLMVGSAAFLTGMQGWFAGGLAGAASGAGLGLAAAWLFHKGDYGGAFGVTAGAIIGTAVGGPLGGIVGAVAGGILGHSLGRLFLKK